MKGKRRRRRQPQSNHDCVISSPVGKLGVMFTNDRIAKIEFLLPKTSLIFPKSIVARRVVIKIKKYFCNPCFQFNLLMDICGTLLQKKIWRAVQKIPYGKTVTYGELAKKLKTGSRVIGSACRLNPLPLIIPCHRVVAATGLGGYCGRSSRTIKIKKWLLAHENKNSIV